MHTEVYNDKLDKLSDKNIVIEKPHASTTEITQPYVAKYFFLVQRRNQIKIGCATN